MIYQKIKTSEFFDIINTEEKAREWAWQVRVGEAGFLCRACGHERFYQHKSPPEIRTCKQCRRQNRLRAGTIFEHSKLPLLIWFRALYLVMQGKRGISALELKRILGMKSYRIAWLLLHKIRAALKDRDEGYKLKGIIELDGGNFGHKHNKEPVLIAVESKDWVDEKGKSKSKAGFAKVTVARENKIEAQAFVDRHIEKDSLVNVDGKNSLRDLKNFDVDWQAHWNDKAVLDHWLPWVHKFISNAKTWVMGTHHGVSGKYIERYLAEYTYRFNRRHDPDSLFHRALKACVTAAPKRAYVLCG